MFLGSRMNVGACMNRSRNRVSWLRSSSLVAALVLSAVAGCETDMADEPEVRNAGARAVPILEQHRGQAPELRTMSTRLITSQQELDALNSQTLGQLPVNFQNQSLVVIALGEQPTAGYWVRIDRVTRYPDRLTVEATANRPGADEILAQVITQPFAAAVIPAQRGLMGPPGTRIDWFVGRRSEAEMAPTEVEPEPGNP